MFQSSQSGLISGRERNIVYILPGQDRGRQCCQISERMSALQDTIQPTLLAGRDKQHFILVSLRLREKDTDFSRTKFVLRRGREGDYYKVLSSS